MKLLLTLMMILGSAKVYGQIKSSNFKINAPHVSFKTEFQIKTIAHTTEFDQLNISVYETGYISWKLKQSPELQDQLDSSLHTEPVEIFSNLNAADIQAFENQLYKFFKDTNQLQQFKKYFKSYFRLQIKILGDPSYLYIPYPLG